MHLRLKLNIGLGSIPLPYDERSCFFNPFRQYMSFQRNTFFFLFMLTLK